MKIYITIVCAILFCTPLHARAAELTTQQAEILGSCNQSIVTAYTAGTISLAEYQFKSIDCYKKAGADNLIPAAWRSATSSEAIQNLNTRGGAAAEALWNNDTLRINFEEITEKLQQTEISPEVAQALSACIAKAVPNDVTSAPPSADSQRAIAECFKDTPYESLLSPVYIKIATVIDCGTDKISEDRIADVTRLIQAPTENEIAIIKKCYVERAAPVISGVAVINLVTAQGVRDVALLIYITVTSLWLGLRGKKTRFGMVQNALTRLPVDLAIVRLQFSDTKKTIRTAVTDRLGRFYLFAPQGAYEVDVTKPGFTFPSLFTDFSPHVTISEHMPVMQEILPADPIIQEPTVARTQWKRLGRHAHAIIAIGSPILGATSAVIVQKWWLVGLAIFNICTYLIFRHFKKQNEPSAYGIILDAEKKPIANCVVRIFETKYNKLIASTLTDTHGRYGVLIGPGTYVIKVGNIERAITIDEARGVIAESFVLV